MRDPAREPIAAPGARPGRRGRRRGGGSSDPRRLLGALALLAVFGLIGRCASGWTGARFGPEEALHGRVVAVRDGDTVDVRSGDRDIRVRVYGVDAPERGQPWSAKAKQFAADLVGNREVALRVHAIDKYQRTVAEVILPDGRNLGDEMLRAGLAWHYDFYSRDAGCHALMEEARAAGRGLWADEKKCQGQPACPTQPVSPRDFRVEERRAGRGPHASQFPAPGQRGGAAAGR
ncbi:MAG: hypothetical protein RL698_1783 [Pseudomonadota bacterium]